MKLASIIFIGLMSVFSSVSFSADRPTQDSQYRLIKDNVSAESSNVRNLGLFIEAYAQNHNGNLPASWSQLNAFASLTPFGSTPIQDRYALITNSSTSDELGGAQVIVIGLAPSKDAIEMEDGRHIVYRTKDGEYLHGWYSESRVQKIITQTHIIMPPLPSEPLPTNSQPLTSRDSHEPMTVQTIFPDSSPVAGTSLHTPTPTAETVQITDTKIPLWLYIVVILSAGLIGASWYRLRSK